MSDTVSALSVSRLVPVVVLDGVGAHPHVGVVAGGWVTATRPGDTGVRAYSTTGPAADTVARRWAAPDPRAPVASHLRRVDAANLAEEHDLISSVAQRPPVLRAGRVEP